MFSSLCLWECRRERESRKKRKTKPRRRRRRRDTKPKHFLPFPLDKHQQTFAFVQRPFRYAFNCFLLFVVHTYREFDLCCVRACEEKGRTSGSEKRKRPSSMIGSERFFFSRPVIVIFLFCQSNPDTLTLAPSSTRRIKKQVLTSGPQTQQSPWRAVPRFASSWPWWRSPLLPPPLLPRHAFTVASA